MQDEIDSDQALLIEQVERIQYELDMHEELPRIKDIEVLEVNCEKYSNIHECYRDLAQRQPQFDPTNELEALQHLIPEMFGIVSR